MTKQLKEKYPEAWQLFENDDDYLPMIDNSDLLYFLEGQGIECFRSFDYEIRISTSERFGYLVYRYNEDDTWSNSEKVDFSFGHFKEVRSTRDTHELLIKKGFEILNEKILLETVEFVKKKVC